MSRRPPCGCGRLTDRITEYGIPYSYDPKAGSYAFRLSASVAHSSCLWATRATARSRLPTVAHAISFWATGEPGSEAADFLGFGVSVAQVALVAHDSDEVENWAKCLNTLGSVAHDLGAQVVATLCAHAGQLMARLGFAIAPVRHKKAASP